MPRLLANKNKFLGKNYNGNITTVRKKLGIKADTIKNSNNIVRAIQENVGVEKVIRNTNTGKVATLSLRDKPLIIRDFLNIRSVGKLLRNDILSSEPYSSNNRRGDEIQIFDKTRQFYGSDIIEGLIKVKFWLQTSSNVFGDESSKRSVEFIYRGHIKNSKNFNVLIKSWDRSIHARKLSNKIDFRGVKKSADFNKLVDKGNYENYNILATPFGRLLIDALMKFRRFDIFIYNIDIKTSHDSSFSLRSMRMREIEFDNIQVNLFNEIIDIKSDKNNCVITYLHNKYPKLKVKKFFGKSEDGINSDEILEFCNNNRIKCIGYDILGNIIIKNDIFNSDMKPLIYIMYNNHMYPIKNKLLKKKTIDAKYEYLEEKEINNKFNSIIKKRIIPKDINITLSKGTPIVNCFTNENIIYHSNNDYFDCEKILDIFGCKNKMTNRITKFNIFNILCELYNIPNYSSYNPILNHYSFDAFTYHKDVSEKWIEDNIDSFTTIDKNKAHGCLLFELDFIYSHDIKYDKIETKILPSRDEIEINNLYLVSPKKSTILLQHTGWMTGEDMIYLNDEDIEYEILCEIKSNRTENKYKQLLKDYYSKTKNLELEDKTILKDIINIFIGKLERGEHTNTSINFNKICNIDEASKSGLRYIKLSNDYCVCYNQCSNYDTRTNKIIVMQIKNKLRQTIYEKMKELNVSDEDIIQINTDSITFINKNSIKVDNINPTDFRSWKYDDYKRNKSCEPTILDERVTIDDILKIYKNNNNNTLNLGYAGCGKTKTIIDKLIPTFNVKSIFADKINDNYIILTPSHASLQFYKKINQPCDVIQKYIYQNTLDKKYKNIIVDEIGMCNNSALDLLYRLSCEGRNIIAYGDFRQLPPPCKNGVSKDISQVYLNLLFKNINHISTNFRNNFPIEYYDELINEKICLLDEIKKYSSKNYNDVEVVICYLNNTTDKYNKLIMDKKGITNTSIGYKMICKTNNMHEFNIYNGYILELVEIDNDEEIVTFKDDCDEYKIPLDIYLKKCNSDNYFKPAYARTIYSLQGSTIKNYYAAPEDTKFFNNSKTAYTIISRLSGDVY